MGTLFALSLAVSLPLLLMWAAYRQFMSKENQPGFNRLTLMSIYGLSVAAVLLSGFWRGDAAASGSDISPLPVSAAAAAPQPIADAINPESESIVAATDGVAPMPEPEFPLIRTKSTSVWDVLLVIYLTGMAVTALLTIVSATRIMMLKRRAGACESVDGVKICVADGMRFSPFCFGRSIMMSRADYESQSRRSIVCHELGHISNRHTADMFVAQLITILCWYNPAAWLMRRELQSVHEYQADSYVLHNGADARAYQLFLIGRIAEPHISAIANHLNHSQLKKRIIMMQKTPSPRVRRLLALTPVAALVCAVSLYATPVIGSALADASESTMPAPAVNYVTLMSDTVPGNGLLNVFVIKGATLTPDIVDNGNYLFPEDISQMGIPDSELTILLRNSGALLSTDKNTVFSLFPSVEDIEVNGVKVPRSEFAKIPSAMLMSVEYDGSKLNVATRDDVNAPNPVHEAIREAELNWQRAQLQAGTPLDAKYYGVVINDVTTYPDNVILSVDYLIRSKEYAGRLTPAEIAAVRWLALGDYLKVEILTDKTCKGELHVFEGQKSIDRSLLSTRPTIGEIISAGRFDGANEVTLDRKSAIGFSTAWAATQADATVTVRERGQMDAAVDMDSVFEVYIDCQLRSVAEMRALPKEEIKQISIDMTSGHKALWVETVNPTIMQSFTVISATGDTIMANRELPVRIEISPDYYKGFTISDEDIVKALEGNLKEGDRIKGNVYISYPTPHPYELEVRFD